MKKASLNLWQDLSTFVMDSKSLEGLEVIIKVLLETIGSKCNVSVFTLSPFIKTILDL
jgi:hypothetical protein